MVMCIVGFDCIRRYNDTNWISYQNRQNPLVIIIMYLHLVVIQLQGDQPNKL